jgi:hypothetical protein
VGRIRLVALVGMTLVAAALALPASAAAVTTGTITRATSGSDLQRGSLAGSVNSDYCNRAGGCDAQHYWVARVEVNHAASTCPNGDPPPPPGEPVRSSLVWESDFQDSNGTVSFDLADVALLGSPGQQVCVYASSLEHPCNDPDSPFCFPVEALLFATSKAIVAQPAPCPPACPTPPTTPPPPPPDKITAFSLLKVASSQKVAKLVVRVGMGEPGTITLGGTVNVPNASKVYKLKSVSATAVPGATVTIRAKLAKKGLKAVKRALRRRRTVKAKLTITAKDVAGNTKTAKRTVRLKR